MRTASLFTVLTLGAVIATGVQAQSRPAGDPLDRLPVPQTTPGTPSKPLQVELQQPEGAAAQQAEQTITPRNFTIQGVKAIDFSQVAQVFAPHAGKPATVTQLVKIAEEATALYRANGFPLSFVFIPAQSFADGAVHVIAVEGFISRVRIEGDAGRAEAKLREIADRIMGERPLRTATYERVSQLLTQVPGVTLTAEAALPGTIDGATELVLKVKRQPYTFGINADLRKPTARAVATAVLNDPLLPGSQLSASTALGDFQLDQLFTLGYTQMVGSDGLAIKSSLVSYRGYPDKKDRPGGATERHNTNQRAQISASYPWLLTARGGVTVEGGAYAVDNTDSYRFNQSGGITFNDETRIRALFSQVTWTDATPTRVRTATAFLAHGLRGAGAAAFQTSNTPGVAGVNPAKLDFTRVSVDASQRDRYANDWGSALSFGAQRSPHTLAASEKVSFGGTRFGRGYAAGDAVGDSGWGIGAEVNRQFKVDAGRWLQQVEPYVLLERAQVSTNVGTTAPKRLESLALGTRLTDGKHYSLDFAIAKPLGDPALSNPDRKLRASLLLTYQLGNL